MTNIEQQSKIGNLAKLGLISKAKTTTISIRISEDDKEYYDMICRRTNMKNLGDLFKNAVVEKYGSFEINLLNSMKEKI